MVFRHDTPLYKHDTPFRRAFKLHTPLMKTVKFRPCSSTNPASPAHSTDTVLQHRKLSNSTTLFIASLKKYTRILQMPSSNTKSNRFGSTPYEKAGVYHARSTTFRAQKMLQHTQGSTSALITHSAINRLASIQRFLVTLLTKPRIALHRIANIMVPGHPSKTSQTERQDSST